MNPSVSPQGEAGGDEAAAKAPRQVKHDRGWSESPMSNTNRSRPRRQQLPRRPRSPTGGRSVPTPAARAIRQSIAGIRNTRLRRRSHCRRRGFGGWRIPPRMDAIARGWLPTKLVYELLQAGSSMRLSAVRRCRGNRDSGASAPTRGVRHRPDRAGRAAGSGPANRALRTSGRPSGQA
jgi:hypothetical protein